MQGSCHYPLYDKHADENFITANDNLYVNPCWFLLPELFNSSCFVHRLWRWLVWRLTQNTIRDKWYWIWTWGNAWQLLLLLIILIWVLPKGLSLSVTVDHCLLSTREKISFVITLINRFTWLNVYLQTYHGSSIAGMPVMSKSMLKSRSTSAKPEWKESRYKKNN